MTKTNTIRSHNYEFKRQIGLHKNPPTVTSLQYLLTTSLSTRGWDHLGWRRMSKNAEILMAP